MVMSVHGKESDVMASELHADAADRPTTPRNERAASSVERTVAGVSETRSVLNARSFGFLDGYRVGLERPPRERSDHRPRGRSP
jgi:hypothetical protein